MDTDPSKENMADEIQFEVDMVDGKTGEVFQSPEGIQDEKEKELAEDHPAKKSNPKVYTGRIGALPSSLGKDNTQTDPLHAKPSGEQRVKNISLADEEQAKYEDLKRLRGASKKDEEKEIDNPLGKAPPKDNLKPSDGEPSPWLASFDYTLEYLKKTKVIPVINLRFKAAVADRQIPFLEKHFQELKMFNLSTSTIVETKNTEEGADEQKPEHQENGNDQKNDHQEDGTKKEKPDFMKEECIPFYLMIVLCMLKGMCPSFQIFEDVLAEWNKIKKIAFDGVENKDVSNDILLTPLKKHFSTAFAKYHQLLILNKKKGMCQERADRIKSWMITLKHWVADAKMKYNERKEKELLDRVNRMHAECDIADSDDDADDVEGGFYGD